MLEDCTAPSSSKEFHACCWGRAEGSGEVYPPRLNLEVNVPAVQLVGYQTSQREIQDLYHEVYLLKRLLSPPPCGPYWIEEAIKDILSSLRSCLQRWGGTTMLEEGQRGAAMAALQLSCQTGIPTWWSPPGGQGGSWAGIGGCLHAGVKYWQTEPGSRWHPTLMPPSHSCCWGRSLDRHEKSPSWHRPERHVTFCDPEEGMPLGKRPHRESQGHLTRAQLERGIVGPCPPEGQNWNVSERCPQPAGAPQISRVTHWNHQ